jgi:hypothetical protein
MFNMIMDEKYLARQRERRRLNGNSITKRYEKTKKGFLMRAYRNMQSRVTGVQWKKYHLYQNLELMPREDFYGWALHNNTFNDLYETWVASGYDRKLSPSVDRINASVGYIHGNIQWLTHSENSRKTSRNHNNQAY